MLATGISPLSFKSVAKCQLNAIQSVVNAAADLMEQALEASNAAIVGKVANAIFATLTSTNHYYPSIE